MEDPNPIMRFFRRPFVRSLLKLSAFIVVGWHVFVGVIFLSVIGMIIFLGVLFAGSGTLPPTDSLGELEHVYGDSYSSNQMLVVPVRGPIVGDTGSDPLTSFADVTSGYEIKQKLYDAAQRSEVRAVLLAIDSPGGTIYGSRAIAEGVEYYQQKTRQPVFAHIQGFGASGAYMAVLPAKQIIADYGTEIGSIGIVMGPFKYYDKVLSESGTLFEGGVMTQNGIESILLTAGKSKDVGSPYRRLSEEERSQLQRSINNEYDQFVQLVNQARGIEPQVIRETIGAMIYDPQTAYSHRLIDAIGSREATYARLAQAADLRDYQVVQETQTLGFLEGILAAVRRTPDKKAAAFDTCNLTQGVLAYHGSVTELCKE